MGGVSKLKVTAYTLFRYICDMLNLIRICSK